MKNTIRRTPPSKPQGRRYFNKLKTKQIPGLVLRIKEGDFFTVRLGELLLTCNIVYGGKTVAIVFSGSKDFIVNRSSREP